MLTPKEIYNNRKIIMNNKSNINAILNSGLAVYFQFNNSSEENFEFMINETLHILEQPTRERNQIPCPCNHIHKITKENCEMHPIEIDPSHSIMDKTNTIIECITTNANTSDYIIINSKYNIGDQIINFGCPVCGRAFTLLPHRIANFDEDDFYQNFADCRYKNLYDTGQTKNIHFMHALLESITYQRLMTIPNVTGVIELMSPNISLLGDSQYEEFINAYIDQYNRYNVEI